MAPALQIPRELTYFLQSSPRVERLQSGKWSRKITGGVPRAGFHVSYHFLQPRRNGSLGPGFGLVTERVAGVVLALSHVEIAAIETKEYSGSLWLGGGFGRWINLNSSRVPRTNFNDLFVKWMANLQFLGILTALALGMGVGVGQAAASRLPPTHSTGWDLPSRLTERSSIETDQQCDLGELDEDTLRRGPRAGDGQPPRIRAHTDVSMAAEAEDEKSDDEARRELEECRAKPYAITVPLKLVGLRGSVPPIWLKDFMGSQGKRVKVMAEFRGSLRSIFSELSSSLESKQVTPRSAMAADLVTVGDSWLSKAVSGGLIRPIENAERFEWYQRMGSKWQTFVRRDEHGLIDPNGKVWGVPYRWGSLVIAYDHRKLERHGIAPIKDWADLWQPKLVGKISMVASPREVVGAVLKALGASYNVKDFERDVPGGRQAMKEKFFALQNQVRLFDDMQYLKTLGAGEVWVAVGWSEDVISFAKRTSNITVVAPQSGTSLWADLWAIPATTTIRSTKVGGRIRGPSPLILQWIDFCLQPARANSFHDVMVGGSPLTLFERKVGSGDYEIGSDHETLTKVSLSDTNQVREASPHLERILGGGLLTPDVVAKSEFLEPLSKTALDDFKWLLSKKAVVPSFPEGLLESLRSRFQVLMGRIRL